MNTYEIHKALVTIADISRILIYLSTTVRFADCELFASQLQPELRITLKKSFVLCANRKQNDTSLTIALSKHINIV
jgi:hypothetical protein